MRNSYYCCILLGFVSVSLMFIIWILCLRSNFHWKLHFLKCLMLLEILSLIYSHVFAALYYKQLEPFLNCMLTFLGMKLWHSTLKSMFQLLHSSWATDIFLAVPLPIQLFADVPGKGIFSWSKSLSPCNPHVRRGGLLDSWRQLGSFLDIMAY